MNDFFKQATLPRLEEQDIVAHGRATFVGYIYDCDEQSFFIKRIDDQGVEKLLKFKKSDLVDFKELSKGADNTPTYGSVVMKEGALFSAIIQCRVNQASVEPAFPDRGDFSEVGAAACSCSCACGCNPESLSAKVHNNNVAPYAAIWW